MRLLKAIGTDNKMLSAVATTDLGGQFYVHTWVDMRFFHLSRILDTKKITFSDENVLIFCTSI